MHADLAAQATYVDGVLVDQMNSIENLIGGSGDDVLTGDAGANVLAGMLGNDTYVIGAGDMIVEAAGEGTDTVRASIDYTLAANLENLVLIGTANLSGTGNGLANTLTGNVGHNLLDGGAGADTMVGGLGDDTYVVGSVADLVVEEMGAGIDTVLSFITYALTANVENLDTDRHRCDQRYGQWTGQLADRQRCCQHPVRWARQRHLRRRFARRHDRRGGGRGYRHGALVDRVYAGRQSSRTSS